MRRYLAVYAVLAISGLGCYQDTEKALGLRYSPPTLPADVPEQLYVDPGVKGAGMLKPGETHLNMKEHYTAGYRQGWELAIEDWEREKRFRFQEPEKFSEWATFSQIQDAMWLGYSDARRQIEEATGTAPRAP